MMGMHGEAFVNAAIQRADLLLAFGMRFDDRVTGNLKTYAPHAKKIHVEIDPSEIEQERQGRRRARLRPARGAATRSSPLVPKRAARGLAARDRGRAPGDARAATSCTADDDGQLLAAHVMHDLWRGTGGDAVIVTDVGQHQMWEAQYYKHERAAHAHHLGRPRHDGLRAAGGDRRQDGAPRRRGLGGRRRRRLPDDAVRARDAAAGAARRQDRDRSTTASSAWCASGRSSSTRSATPRRRCSHPDFVKLADGLRHPGVPRRTPAKTWRRRSQTARADQGTGARRVPGREGRSGLPDGPGGRAICTT